MLIVMITISWSYVMIPKFVYAEDKLMPYREVLIEMNNKLGTDYSFPEETQLQENGQKQDDIVKFFSRMTLEQFRKYIYKAYLNQISNGSNQYSRGEEFNIQSIAFSKKQNVYYNSNSIFINTTIYSADGCDRYSSINNYGYTKKGYPYYKPNKMTKTFGSGNKTVTCKFFCTQYVAQNIVSSSKYTLVATFSASGGDVNYTSIYKGNMT